MKENLSVLLPKYDLLDMRSFSMESANEKAFAQLKSFCRKKHPLLEKVPEEKKIIVLVDIVGFSTVDSRSQMLNIYTFQKFLMTFLFSNKLFTRNRIRISHFIPTGDGCYILIEDCDKKIILDFLLAMIAGFQMLKDYEDERFSLRASVLSGSCIPFWDIACHLNYVGEGLNEAERILSGGRKALEKNFIEQGHTESKASELSQNSLFLEENFFADLDCYDERICGRYFFPDIEDKHGKKRNITVLQGVKEIEL